MYDINNSADHVSKFSELISSFELSQLESQFLLLSSYQMNAQLIWYNNFSKFCLLYCVGY